MPIAADDATDRIGQLIILTERLTELVAESAQAFEQHRPLDAAARIDETSRLANIYRHESARVRADPSLVTGGDLEQRRRLIRATEAFDAVLARQGRALSGAKAVAEGLVRAIAEEVASQRDQRAGYGPTANAAVARATAITLNKRA